MASQQMASFIWNLLHKNIARRGGQVNTVLLALGIKNQAPFEEAWCSACAAVAGDVQCDFFKGGESEPIRRIRSL